MPQQLPRGHYFTQTVTSRPGRQSVVESGPVRRMVPPNTDWVKVLFRIQDRVVVVLSYCFVVVAVILVVVTAAVLVVGVFGTVHSPLAESIR
jgi:hypothetical protein